MTTRATFLLWMLNFTSTNKKKKINKKILNLSNYYPVLETSSVDFKGPFENASYKCKNEMYPEELQRLRKILEPH